MVLKIYGDWLTSVQRIVCVLIEKGVPYEMIPISVAKGEHKTPQYLEKQPFGQIPYIVS
jgi:glutathione S-transferase